MFLYYKISFGLTKKNIFVRSSSPGGAQPRQLRREFNNLPPVDEYNGNGEQEGRMDPPPPPPGYRPGHYQGGAAPQQQHNNNNNNEMKTGQIYNSHEQIQEYVCYYLF